MPTYTYSPLAGAGWQFFNNSGVPLAGGLLYTYAAGTTTPAPTYTTSVGNVANTNPIVLDSAGRTPAQIWLDSTASYKFILQTSTGVQIWSNDNISGGTPAAAVSYSPTGNFTATTVQAALDEIAASTGANIVKYNQGATGAVTRTVKSKLQEVVSVKDFGAVGDGIADDTTAIQAAINALSQLGVGGVVRLPAGTYKVTSNINLTWPNGADPNSPARVTIQGDGVDITSIFDYRAGTPTGGCLTVDFSTFGSRFFTCDMGGFSIIKKVNATTIDIPTNTYTIGTGIGLYMNNVPNLGSFDNIRITGYDTCVLMTDCIGVTFNNLMIYGCDLGVVATTVANSEPTVLTFNYCSASACKSVAYLISGGGPVRFNGGIVGPGGTMSGSSQGVSAGIFYGTSAFITTELVVDGTYFELNGGSADIYINTPTATATRSVCNITNCFFARNSSTLYTANNILVANASSTATMTVNTIGNGFKGYSPYVASASRRYIAKTGTNSGTITIFGLGNFYNDPTEAPVDVTNITGGGSGGSQDLQSVTSFGASTTINSTFNGANIGTFSGIPAVTSSGTTVGLGTSTNAVALNGVAWQGAGDATNDLGSSSVGWNNLYLKNNFAWNGYTIAAPAGGTTTFLRNDGTWQTPAGSGLGTVTSVGTGNGLTGGPITSTGTIAINYAFAGTWTANQNFNGANIGTFSGIPSVTSTGTTVGFGNSTNAAVLNGAVWQGASDGTNSLGSASARWSSLYLLSSFVWNGYTIPAPSGGTTTFLRNDGTWATPAGGSGGTVTSITAGSGLSGGTITTSGTISLNTGNSNTWSATQIFSSAVQTNTINANGSNVTIANTFGVVPSVGVAPAVDGVYVLGAPSFRWSTVYATTGTINTSDAGQKQDVRALNEAEARTAVKLKQLIRAFKFKDAVTAKGDNARIHVGVIAQDVAAAFASEGLDANNYGLFCSDVLEDNSTQLGIRYDELLAFIISAL